MTLRTVPSVDFTSGCSDSPTECCKCGFVGQSYAFGTVGGRRACVRCCGSVEEQISPAKRRAAARGREKWKGKRPRVVDF